MPRERFITVSARPDFDSWPGKGEGGWPCQGIQRRVVWLDYGGVVGQQVDLLIDVLRADPRDAQALIILGNHYARRGGDPVAARRFLERAAELTPEDPLVYNSLAAPKGSESEAYVEAVLDRLTVRIPGNDIA